MSINMPLSYLHCFISPTVLSKHVGLKLNLGTLNQLVKACILVAFVWLVWHILQDKESLRLLYVELCDQIRTGNKILLIAALALMPLNWLLESIKWIELNKPIHSIPLKQALYAVLMGLTISIFTPARVGEYLGRIVNIRPRDKWKALAAQFMGSVIQLIFIILGGIWGIATIVRAVPEADMIDQKVLAGLAAMMLLLLIALYRVPQILQWLRQKVVIPNFRKLIQHVQFVSQYSPMSLIGIAVLTILRLAIYVVQYWLLLRFFGLMIPTPISIAAILTTYLIQSGLPLPLLLGLFARGEVTLLVWKFFPVNELTLLSSSYLLWVINVFLPALIGAGILMKTDFPKSFGFEKK